MVVDRTITTKRHFAFGFGFGFGFVFGFGLALKCISQAK
jgi:hypothetical protein